MKKGGRHGGTLLALCFLPFLFFSASCSLKSDRKSFNSSLDGIDALINQRLYREAVQELSKIEKDAFSSWAQIGIFRRYRQCDENQRAQEFLSRSLKKNPENPELRAVYSNFLLRQGRTLEALECAKKLQGTKYGSVYSEAALKDVLSRLGSGDTRGVFRSEEYYPIYFDAYVGSRDNSWLRNCALLLLSKGAYEGAAEIRPSEVYDARDSYFWALVMYDARRFGDCVGYLETARKLAANKTNRSEKSHLEGAVAILEGDAYTSLKDEEGAEAVRRAYISSLEKTPGGWLLGSGEIAEKSNVIFTNSARWALDNQNYDEARNLLLFAVNEWPDYVPALSLYVDFAYRSSLEAERDFVQLQLSDSALPSLDMERYDSRVKIPLSDAVLRIEESLSRTRDPLLYIVSLDLRYKTSTDLNQKQKAADLWNILEKNALSPSVYPALMLDYALSYLLLNGEKDEAWRIFYRYVEAGFGVKNDGFFFENLIEKLHELDPVALEYGAYFSALNDRADDAILLYENLVYEHGFGTQERPVSPMASDTSCMNLAMIYSSTAQKDRALSLYGSTFGRCANLKVKSEIMRRMAEIYFIQGDLKNARRSAEYSLTLDRTNADSRLLMNRIRASR